MKWYNCRRLLLAIYMVAVWMWLVHMYIAVDHPIYLWSAFVVAALYGTQLQGLITDRYKKLLDATSQQRKDIAECRQTIMDCVTRKYGGRG